MKWALVVALTACSFEHGLAPGPDDGRSPDGRVADAKIVDGKPIDAAGSCNATACAAAGGTCADSSTCEIDTTGVCDLASVTTWNPVTTPVYNDKPTRYKPGRPRYSYDQYEVYLGGVASPAVTQRQGTYTASIGVLLVVN